MHDTNIITDFNMGSKKDDHGVNHNEMQYYENIRQYNATVAPADLNDKFSGIDMMSGGMNDTS